MSATAFDLDVIFDNDLWQQATWSDDQARQMRVYLEALMADLNYQQRRNRADISEVTSLREIGEVGPQEMGERQWEYADWRRRASTVHAQVQKRIAELRERFADELVSVQRRRSQAAQNAMKALALAVYDLQSDVIDEGQLFAVLDDTTFDFGKLGAMSLRRAIDDGVFERQVTPHPASEVLAQRNEASE